MHAAAALRAQLGIHNLLTLRPSAGSFGAAASAVPRGANMPLPPATDSKQLREDMIESVAVLAEFVQSNKLQENDVSGASVQLPCGGLARVLRQLCTPWPSA